MKPVVQRWAKFRPHFSLAAFHFVFSISLLYIRVDMSKGLQLAYNLHAKTLTNHLLAYNLTKPLTQLKHNILDLKILQVFFKNRGEILVF